MHQTRPTPGGSWQWTGGGAVHQRLTSQTPIHAVYAADTVTAKRNIQSHMVRVGTAGWSLPVKPSQHGSHLHHYSQSLDCAEINSSFYRPHRASTWARWAAETPADFRFSIKAPKAITHEARLCGAETLLQLFVEQFTPLGDKAGPMLLQLPPKLGFEPSVADRFFATLRAAYSGHAALEPRNPSWFTAEADALLVRHAIARVAADPPAGSPIAAEPGGCSDLVYFRLHGSPRTYYSEYSEDFLVGLAQKLKNSPSAWVIFDNTALAHAYSNALHLHRLLER